MVSPLLVGMTYHVFVVVALVSCHFGSEKVGLDIRFVFVLQFNFGQYESFILIEELIDFNNVFAAFDEVAGFVDASWHTEFHHFLCILQRYFYFKFVARESVLARRPFDGQIAFVVADAHSDGFAGFCGEIALLDVGLVVG